MNALTSQDDETGFSAAEYNDVAMGSELLAINLLATKFDISPDVYGTGEGVELAYDLKTVSCYHDDEDNYVAAIFRYSVDGKAKRKKAFHCHADFAVMYRVPENAKPSAALGFCKNTGKFAAYPYFRSHVSHLTWNAGLNLPPLPARASTAHIPKPKKSSAETE